MKQRFLIAFVLLTVPIASAQTYTISDLGSLSPTAINAWGQVVGNINGQAYIWTQIGGQKPLGTLTGGTFSSAAGINDVGAVVGSADGTGTVVSLSPPAPNENCTNLTQPFVWTGTKGMRGLGSVMYGGEVDQWNVEACDVPYYADDINAFGQVVGNNREFASYKWGFLWTNAIRMTLFANDFQTAATGINNRGQVVGQTGIFALYVTSHAATWNNGTETDLGALGGADPDWNFCSGATSVNDLGRIVGWSSTVSDISTDCFRLTAVHAFLWKSGAGMQDLGTLPGDTASVAHKMNYFSQVVGSSGNTVVWQDGQPGGSIEVTGRPFIWSERSGMLDLNTLIRTNSGWVLDSATGINIWGQIVGSGTLNGQPHGFLLTPKNPFRLR